MKVKWFILAVVFQIGLLISVFAFQYFNYYGGTVRFFQTAEVYPTEVGRDVYISYNINDVDIANTKIDFDYKKEPSKYVYLVLDNSKPVKVIEVTDKKPKGAFVKAHYNGYGNGKLYVYIKPSKFNYQGGYFSSEKSMIFYAKILLGRDGSTLLMGLEPTDITLPRK